MTKKIIRHSERNFCDSKNVAKNLKIIKLDSIKIENNTKDTIKKLI